MSLLDRLLPGVSHRSKLGDSEDIYAEAREAEQLNNHTMPEVGLKGLPPAFMFNMQGYDHSAIARTIRAQKSQDSVPSTNESEDELRHWLETVCPTVSANSVFGVLTRDPLAANRPDQKHE